ncbi:protein-glutamine gamma-glutamyltransferase 6-like [Acanthochromis polyacanthus]|uniref:protein-glutamine gamma-glutamyltransferase 6-like n=1 Tax=Acanthochromis polyacanthus TaxID=80966 RepID=UPI002234CDE1|nr:protein-glutamine gamma-glutamyltransferase 6-like [Acanthochromis polyacanthus]
MTEEIKPSIFGGVDFHNVDNNKEHHTNEVSQQRLVVRRGQNFKMTLTLTQPFNPEFQQLVLTAKTGGQHASEDKGTLSHFGYPDNIRRSSSVKAVWKVELPTGFSLPSKTVALSVTPPADAPVGEYELFGKLQAEEKSLGKLVVLFNPWCSEDSVYLLDELKRKEYILNEHGIIFIGSANYISPGDWDYGQFEENMVDICLKILDRNHKHDKNPAEDVASRSDPIYVSRVISAMINSNDDSGVLEGRWEFPYIGGKRPTHWTGSYAILNKWLQSGCRPVKYGQCWVFAGVMCSVMRLLGIPCRVVTNFESAHDVNMDLIIQIYVDYNGLNEEYTQDSIWNFHVWTEGWMKRPDLGSDGEYDGWQVVDPTPQELSDGVFCCGPASVKGILNGQTGFKYDAPFIYAEVNADHVVLFITESGEVFQIESDTTMVGKNISTKAVGSNKREDITNTYKYKEGSYSERMFYTFAIDGGVGSGGTDGGAGSAGTDGGVGSGGTDGGAGSGGTDGGAGSAGTDGGAGSGGTDGGAGSGGTDGGAGSAGTDGGAGSGGTDGGAGSAGTDGGAGSAGTDGGVGSGGTDGGAGSGGTDGGAGSGGTDGGAGSGGTDGGAGSAGTDGGAGSGGTDGGAGSGGTDGGAGSGGTDGGAGSAGTDGGAGSGGTDGGAGSAGTDGGVGSGGTDGGAGSGGTEGEATPQPPSPVTIRFEEVSRLINGKDVNLNLVLKSKSSDARPLSIPHLRPGHEPQRQINWKILTEDKEGDAAARKRSVRPHSGSVLDLP